MKTPTDNFAADSLKALSEIAFTINSIQEIGPLLSKVLELAMDVLAAERGFVLLKSAAAPGFEVKSSSNIPGEHLAGLTSISNSVVLEVMASGEPIILFETGHDPRYGKTESIVLQKIQSIACVPLSIKNQQIGAIYLDSLTKRSRFTTASLPFLTAFANQAAIAIENARLYESLRAENRRLRDEVQRMHRFEELIGQSPAMRGVFDIMNQVLETDATVLIQGESGTGKELVARAIHYNGLRRDKPFLAFFCGSLPDSLLESELFGHKRGAFTGAVTDKKGLFETADGGTFFLDEIGDLSHQIQTKLLRVLQEGEIKRIGENHLRTVDVRIISATNKRLEELIRNGTFREDLYYRLNTIAVDIPALRERKSDIPLLAHHFLDKHSGKKPGIKGFSEQALDAMRAYHWPGNVRELENSVERAAILAKGELIEAGDLKLPRGVIPAEPDTGMTLREAEKRLVERALNHNHGNVSETAKQLAVSRRWLHYKLKEWQI